MENVKATLEDAPITHLSPEERAQTVTVIADIFGNASLAVLRIELWHYLKSATTAQSWSLMGQPGHALILQKRLEKLMDNCWLLLQEKEEQDGEIIHKAYAPGSQEQVESDRMMLSRYDKIQRKYFGNIRLLNPTEIENPYLVLKSFFEMADMAAWKELLTTWTEYALSSISILEDKTDSNLLLKYDQLEKLLEAAFYLCMDVEDETEQKGSEKEPARVYKSEKLTPYLEEEIITFLKAVPPGRLNRNLRKMFLDYLMFNKYGLPDNFNTMVSDLYRLAELLDIAQRETQDWQREEDEFE